MRRNVVTKLTPWVAAAALLAGCGSSPSGGASGAATTGSASAGSIPALSGQLTVLAAASLTGVFTDLGRQFEAAHPGTKIMFSFGPAPSLANQIIQGAPADVFATASKQSMDQLMAAKAAGTPTTFAKNVMEIAVPPANRARITTLTDLGKPGVKVAVCATSVACGTLARKIFTNAGVTVMPATNEADVKATLTKVELGEVDAGIVFVTDVLAASGKVKGITIPAQINASTSYPIAALTKSKNAALARAFVDYVLSPGGAAVLSAAGFQKP